MRLPVMDTEEDLARIILSMMSRESLLSQLDSHHQRNLILLEDKKIKEITINPGKSLKSLSLPSQELERKEKKIHSSTAFIQMG